MISESVIRANHIVTPEVAQMASLAEKVLNVWLEDTVLKNIPVEKNRLIEKTCSLYKCPSEDLKRRKII